MSIQQDIRHYPFTKKKNKTNKQTQNKKTEKKMTRHTNKKKQHRRLRISNDNTGQNTCYFHHPFKHNASHPSTQWEYLLST